MLDEQKPQPTFTLREVQVLDESGGFTAPVDVAVMGGVVVAVEANVEAPDEGPEIDCSGLWLMPGIFDCHAHLDCFTEDVLATMDMDVIRWTLQAVHNGRSLLELGVTSVRDPGGATPGIRDGIDAGWVEGPQLFVSGPPLSQTGGHADGYLPSLGHEAITGFMVPEYPGRPPYLVDGPDEMRKAIRLHVRSGVDWIKICTTGGLLSTVGDHPLKSEFTDEEISVAVSEAKRAGVPVATHAYGGDGLSAAVRCGVRSIEHGIYLTEEQAAEMAKRDCWLVPTLVICHELADLADNGGIDERSARRVAEIMPSVGQQVAVARDAGVRIAMGSDLVRQGRNLEEIPLLGEAGLSPEEALLAATANGAELCGAEDRGAIASGKVFDAILLDTDPSDLEVFRRRDAVTGVFQAGRPVRSHERFARVPA
jgi:imidazolonepropionase-like amidohydrolase